MIGTTDIFLTDSARHDKLAPKKNTLRRLYIKAWYPSDNSDGKPVNNYMEHYDTKILLSMYKSLGMNDSLVKVLMSSPTYSFQNLKLSDAQQQYPVLIFSQGYYFGLAELYTSLMENLASHGYIVFSITHPYEQPIVDFPDGYTARMKKKFAALGFLQWVIADKFQFRSAFKPKNQDRMTRRYLRKLKRFDKSMDIWMADNLFFVNYLDSLEMTQPNSIFSNRLNMTQMGSFGQSFGGAVAGQLAYKTQRFKAAANLDCFQFGDIIDNDLNTPFLLIQSQQMPKWAIGNDIIYSNTTSPFYSVMLKNSKHYITSDATMLPVSEVKRAKLIGDIKGPDAIGILNKYLLNFFDYYVKDIAERQMPVGDADENIIYKTRNVNDTNTLR